MKNIKLESLKKIFDLIDSGYEICIGKFDKDVLEQSFQDFDWNGNLGSSADFFSVDFVLEDGQILISPLKIGLRSGSNFAYSSFINRQGETIAEAIDRLGVASQLKYILVYNDFYSNWNFRQEWHKLTIYKISNKK